MWSANEEREKDGGVTQDDVNRFAEALTFERAGGDKPVCVAQFLMHLRP